MFPAVVGDVERACATRLHGHTSRLLVYTGDAVEASDEVLVQQIGRGNRDACREVVGRHLGRIVGFAQRTLGNRPDAEDVAQEVFLRLWTHAARWRPRGAQLTTWLHKVALNLCLDRLRRRQLPAGAAPEPADTAPSPAAHVHQQEIAHHVNRALMELPEHQRAAIALCHYQGLRNAEAADVLGVSVEALESLLARGRRTLRARLRDLAPDLLAEG